MPCAPDSSSHRNFIMKAKDQSEKLNILVNQLFQSSKINLGHIPMEMSHFNLMHVLKEAKEGFEAAGANGISLEGPHELALEADKEKVGQVIRNLLDNALKYSPLIKKVSINVQYNQSEVTVSVQDFCIGIPVEKLNQLFDRYYREESTSQNYSGMGLGLYISFEIVRKHGGEIGVNSTVGKGSTFWFTLPLVQKEHNNITLFSQGRLSN